MNNYIDIFEEYLNKKDESEWIKRALTDSSYNNYRCKGIKKSDSRYEELHTPLKENKDLATYGDSLIKFCYLELMLDKTEHLTIEKSEVESDEFFVTKIAPKYNLLEYILRDTDDTNMPNNYNYAKNENGNKNNNPHKYIATAVEAMVGAIYKETKKLDLIKDLLKTWIDQNH